MKAKPGEMKNNGEPESGELAGRRAKAREVRIFCP
jgi:hypothetical protein